MFFYKFLISNNLYIFCILQRTERLETRRAALEKVVKEQEPPTDSSEEGMFCM